jgi:3-dehydroquinate dehydratase II
LNRAAAEKPTCKIAVSWNSQGSYKIFKGQNKMPQILILNGPNLNLLGSREPAVYGHTTLADLEQLCQETAQRLGHEADCRQSNHEGVLIDALHEAAKAHAQKALLGVVLNAGAYTHTSVALHDAIKASAVPVIEVHLSNVHAREPFRHHSYISPAAWGVIVGLGPEGYVLAIDALVRRWNQMALVHHDFGKS